MHYIKTLVMAIVLLAALPLQEALSIEEIPVKNTVTMIDLGSTTCVPCKLMEPILKELRQEYTNRAAIVFVDVGKDRDSARKFGVRVIPTQIFFDASGKEIWRHAGFLEKKVIAQKLDTLLQ